MTKRINKHGQANRVAGGFSPPAPTPSAAAKAKAGPTPHAGPQGAVHRDNRTVVG